MSEEDDERGREEEEEEVVRGSLNPAMLSRSRIILPLMLTSSLELE